jgi:predicted nucleic acid-binding protein
MIVVDANFLVLMFDPTAMPHVQRGTERVEHFIRELSENRDQVMIPALVIAEVVAGRVERAQEIISELRRQRVFIIQPFDDVIAIETGHLIRSAFDRLPDSQKPSGWRHAMKYDAQIAATAIVRIAKAIVTGDGGFSVYLHGSEIELIEIAGLPLPPENPQGSLAL